jgi:hypothetical protein
VLGEIVGGELFERVADRAGQATAAEPARG